MFKQLTNLDSAFKHTRLVTLVVILACTGISFYSSYNARKIIENSQDKVYVVAQGKLIEAIGIDKKEVLNVQLRKHVENFHYYFYALEPDEDLIKKNITKALYLADDRAKYEYDNLREQGYYTGIVAGNISQRIDMDSILINTDNTPYHFTYYGKLKIIRSTSIATRSLVTEGTLRALQAISDNNSYGYLIENWRILANTDLRVEKR
ncbi:MAG: conjugative transposon protein TraK [Chitinophagaceae bacterium]|nr:MAG: conjugative transposon protein TraK [Chitinophagaceae bacterium]